MRTDDGYRRLRRGRVSEAGRVYLVTFVARDRARHFADAAIARSACRAIHDPRNSRGARILCWVLMPDHCHALVELTGGVELSSVVSRLKACVAREVNRTSGRAGSLWMAGFHDRAMRHDDDLVEASRYIVANPLRASLVDEVGQYPYWNAVWF